MNADDATNLALWRAALPGSVLLDGFHAIKHALRFGADVRIVLTSDRALVRALAAELASDTGAYIEDNARDASQQTLRELVPRGSPTAIVALAAQPATPDPAAPRATPIVLLENPRNLGNVGAVVRLAAGFGVSAVLTTGDLDPWHPTVVRGAAGLHFATSVARVGPDDLPDAPVYVLDPQGEDLRESVVPDHAILAFGTERHGVSPQLRARADRLVSIPMRPMVSSYNLATSVGMTLFAWSVSSANAPK